MSPLPLSRTGIYSRLSYCDLHVMEVIEEGKERAAERHCWVCIHSFTVCWRQYLKEMLGKWRVFLRKGKLASVWGTKKGWCTNMRGNKDIRSLDACCLITFFLTKCKNGEGVLLILLSHVQLPTPVGWNPEHSVDYPIDAEPKNWYFRQSLQYTFMPPHCSIGSTCVPQTAQSECVADWWTLLKHLLI